MASFIVKNDSGNARIRKTSCPRRSKHFQYDTCDDITFFKEMGYHVFDILWRNPFKFKSPRYKLLRWQINYDVNGGFGLNEQ